MSKRSGAVSARWELRSEDRTRDSLYLSFPLSHSAAVSFPIGSFSVCRACCTVCSRLLHEREAFAGKPSRAITRDKYASARDSRSDSSRLKFRCRDACCFFFLLFVYKKKTILFFEWFSVGSLCCLFIVREENQSDDVIGKEKRIRSGIYGKERSCRRGPQEDAEWVSRSLYWRNRVSSRFSSPAKFVTNFANRYTRERTTYFVWFQLKSLDPQGNLERLQTSDKPLWTHA